MRTILNNKRILVSRAIRQQNRTVRWQATKCNARERISKHKAFNQVSGTLAAGTMRKLMITLQHSPVHEIQAIEPRSMHIHNLELKAFRCVRQWSGVCSSFLGEFVVLFWAGLCTESLGCWRGIVSLLVDSHSPKCTSEPVGTKSLDVSWSRGSTPVGAKPRLDTVASRPSGCRTTA